VSSAKAPMILTLVQASPRKRNDHQRELLGLLALMSDPDAPHISPHAPRIFRDVSLISPDAPKIYHHDPKNYILWARELDQMIDDWTWILNSLTEYGRVTDSQKVLVSL
jgi:hypothetical protein